jgi:hypothetical protein
MDLEAATARIAELEGEVTTLRAERGALAERTAALETARATLEGRLVEAAGVQEAASGELTEARSRGLTNLRRALLAEQAGQLVPELVAGDDEESLLASVEVARQAHARVLESARAAIASQTVPAGAPSARGVSAAGLSPLEMIESGLRR